MKTQRKETGRSVAGEQKEGNNVMTEITKMSAWLWGSAEMAAAGEPDVTVRILSSFYWTTVKAALIRYRPCHALSLCLRTRHIPTGTKEKITRNTDWAVPETKVVRTSCQWLNAPWLQIVSLSFIFCGAEDARCRYSGKRWVQNNAPIHLQENALHCVHILTCFANTELQLNKCYHFRN